MVPLQFGIQANLSLVFGQFQPWGLLFWVRKQYLLGYITGCKKIFIHKSEIVDPWGISHQLSDRTIIIQKPKGYVSKYKWKQYNNYECNHFSHNTFIYPILIKFFSLSFPDSWFLNVGIFLTTLDLKGFFQHQLGS